MPYPADHPYAKHPTDEQIERIADAALLCDIRQAASAAEEALLKLEEKLYDVDYRRQSIDVHEMYVAVAKIGDTVNLDFAMEPEDIQNLAEEAAA